MMSDRPLNVEITWELRGETVDRLAVTGRDAGDLNAALQSSFVPASHEFDAITISCNWPNAFNADDWSNPSVGRILGKLGARHDPAD